MREMKKMFVILGLGLLSGALWAANFGPFVYDDKGAGISGIGPLNGRGYVLPSASSTTIAGNVSDSYGQMIACTTCANGQDGKNAVCESTKTADSNSWVLVSSTSQKCQ